MLQADQTGAVPMVIVRPEHAVTTVGRSFCNRSLPKPSALTTVGTAATDKSLPLEETPVSTAAPSLNRRRGIRERSAARPTARTQLGGQASKELTCEKCGAQFFEKKPGQRFCSSDCWYSESMTSQDRSKTHRGRRTTYVEFRECEFCGKPFEQRIQFLETSRFFDGGPSGLPLQR